MSHTPGPWTLFADGWRYEAEVWENQSLVAAAPELLEALKLAAGLLALNDPSDLMFESEEAGKIRAAIAKAEGK